VGDVEEFNEYPWTGHSVIMGTVEQEGQDIDTVLRYFGETIDASPLSADLTPTWLASILNPYPFNPERMPTSL